MFSSGRSSLTTGLWARGLAEYAEIADWLGNAASAAWARGLWEQARDGYEDFWDPARGSYVDHILAGERQPAMSQAAGAIAIVSGLAPQDRWAGIIDVITDPSRLVVRSWIGGEDGGYDGVIGLTRSAALEYAPRGIRVNAVCPGTIETPMVTDMIAKGELSVPEAVANQPIGRLGRADEIAGAVLWLCSPGASLVVGVALPVDGGYTAR